MAGQSFTRLVVSDPIDSDVQYLDIKVQDNWIPNSALRFTLELIDSNLATVRSIEAQMSGSDYNAWTTTDFTMLNWAVSVTGVSWDGLIHTDGYQIGVSDAYLDGYFV